MSGRSLVYGLGYLGVRGDRAAWDEFALEVLGLGPGESVDGESRYRTDWHTHRLSVVEGEPGLSHVGWEVTSREALDAVRAAIEDAGIKVRMGDPEEAAQRDVSGLLTCEDPAGNSLEFFWGPAVRATRPIGSRHGVEFLTGELGLGHVVMTTDHFEAMVTFYQQTLGFHASDVMTGTPSVVFLSCNARHHTIALVDAPVESFHHMMLEVTSMDMVGQAYDRVHDRGIQLVMTLGRHWNDHMTSFYVESPSGFAVEYGWGGRIIDRATWSTVRGTGEISFWGHRPVTDEMKEMTGEH